MTEGQQAGPVTSWDTSRERPTSGTIAVVTGSGSGIGRITGQVLSVSGGLTMAG